MPGITLEQAQDQLTAALADLAAARKLQEYQVAGSAGGRRVQRAPVASLQAQVDRWQQIVSRLSRRGSGLAVTYGVPGC